MDTIVASASPWGRSAVAVLRLSGPEAQEIAMRLCLMDRCGNLDVQVCGEYGWRVDH